LKVTVPTITDTVAAIASEELSLTLGAVLPVNEGDSIGEIGNMKAEVNTPPDTPSAK
jgi:hypothetical protein